MWDMETQMPKEGQKVRSRQRALLSGLVHAAKTSKEYKAKLERLIDFKTVKVKENLSGKGAEIVSILAKDFNQSQKLPISFVEEFSQVSSVAMGAWSKARSQNSFCDFLPHLSKIIQLCQKKADYIGYKNHPYDALIDEFESAMTSAKLDNIFSKLQEGLVSLLRQVKKVDISCLKANFPKIDQLALSKKLLEFIGLNENFSRLDLSAHPFCTSLHPQDIRMTTRIDESNLIECLSSVLHEAGHGLYEHQLPATPLGTPLTESCSLGIHESQSRFMEVIIGQTKAFWIYFYPLVQKKFPKAFAQVSLDTFYRALHYIEPGFIRIDADELTYNLHIIVRYECEKKLIEGSLKAKDLPEFWNDLMVKNLGIRPPTDTKGCLQDIHWSMGAFGYFPTYTLGNLAASSLFATMKQELPAWEEELNRGDFSSIRHFLYEKIHKHGRRYSSETLLKKATGSSYQANTLLDYLKVKYLTL